MIINAFNGFNYEQYVLKFRIDLLGEFLQWEYHLAV